MRVGVVTAYSLLWRGRDDPRPRPLSPLASRLPVANLAAGVAGVGPLRVNERLVGQLVPLVGVDDDLAAPLVLDGVLVQEGRQGAFALGEHFDAGRVLVVPGVVGRNGRFDVVDAGPGGVDLGALQVA